MSISTVSERHLRPSKKPANNTDWLNENGIDGVYLREQRSLGLSKPLPMPREMSQFEGSDGPRAVKMAFPEGTTRVTMRGFEEVTIPAAKKTEIVESELVKIEEFDPWAQLAFVGFKRLNRIQSKMFHAAFKTNENLLVCAPTGAGKTNIALMTILHEIGQHFRAGALKRDEFKIIYVAPMKALVQEMVENFKKRLGPLGIVVRELTGDMSLTKTEINETQLIVTTPEKWDVITRKTATVSLTQLVRLLIIDEVHLLHDDRGSVLETLVARTLRQVETTQSMTRIVGLSATLPNYEDVAYFLRVNPDRGLFFFGPEYRPVPLKTHYIGITEKDQFKRKTDMNEVCFEKMVEALARGKQVMIFVHARGETARSARAMIELAQFRGKTDLLTGHHSGPAFSFAQREVDKSRNFDLKEIFQHGFGIHHAGMLRSDRNLVEKLFADGQIKVLCCTATLAWGVNLPAHTVIIKGTQIYDPERGGFIDLGILDVMQIFGRAGRPQFDTEGTGIIITGHERLNHYLALMNRALPIESQFIKALPDHLNAEIVLGTVTNIREAIIWLSYTYLHIRMMKNPLAYGISALEKQLDPSLSSRRHDLILDAARRLDKVRMIRFDEASGSMYVTDLGRISSHFYISNISVETYNEQMRPGMTDAELFNLIAQSNEFENLKVREEEIGELERLVRSSCPIPVKGGLENKTGKANILLQAYISQARIETSALVSDTMFVVQSAPRIVRGLFEVALRRGWTTLTDKLLNFSKIIERRLWPFSHPLRQLGNQLTAEVLKKLEEKKASIEKLVDLTDSEIGAMINHPRLGATVAKAVSHFPKLGLEVTIQPVTRTVLRVQLVITALFEWSDRIHGTTDPWWIWVEDPDNEHIYHSEQFQLHRMMLKDKEPLRINFTIPIFDPLPAQYYVRAVSDKWLGAETTVPVSFKHLILPERHPPHTALLDLQPLPVTALKNKNFEKLYSKFTHFNPLQTQVFHTLYHSDVNVLLGSPTGSGKTIAAEFAVLRVMKEYPRSKIVYIGPLKALVREREKDWRQKFTKTLGKGVVELTGDTAPDMRALASADIVLTTPEKWDGITRDWRRRTYVQKVRLVIFDEIHMLGADRGPIVEVIVSRMRYIATQTGAPIRIIGLSTALANARDLSDWLGIGDGPGLFNFHPSVRPVPLEVHIAGFEGKHYCPRMASMNKPTYSAIMLHSPTKPTLVFVSSRRQTRLTALDLISFCAADERQKQWCRMTDEELEDALLQCKDSNMKHTLPFGIGLHHAGLQKSDTALVENLFLQGKILVVVATSTLAWGVNLPAHLVVVKGTEFYDAKTRRYVDFPITDVLQMMGRAGRPQFDNQGKAVILVHEPKKDFYKKFLYEPFPVESELHNCLADHLNAEISSGAIVDAQSALDYLTWTFFYRRLMMNPTYYGLEGLEPATVSQFLSELIEQCLNELERSKCIEIDEKSKITATTLGHLASYYYLEHWSVRLFSKTIKPKMDMGDIIEVLSCALEFSELPVRHNEDNMNEKLAHDMQISTRGVDLSSPHFKTQLLLLAHFAHAALPIADYMTDTKSVLDQVPRVIMSMVDIAADKGYLTTAMKLMHLMQCVVQGQWLGDNPLAQLPFSDLVAAPLKHAGMPTLAHVASASEDQLRRALGSRLPGHQLNGFLKVARTLPLLKAETRVVAQSDVVLIDGPNSVSVDTYGNKKYAARIKLTRDSPMATRVYAPRYPKPKDEGFWLVIADSARDNVLALKKISIGSPGSTVTLSFESHPDLLSSLSLLVVCDAYIGLDTEFPLVDTKRKNQNQKTEEL